MKIKVDQVIAILLTLLFLSSCSRSYDLQVFSFPPGSKPHENDWTYLCKVIDWALFAVKPCEKGKRQIEIIIHDKNKTNVLQDKFEIESASIESKIQWDEFEQVTLELYERGNKYAEDDYNKQLVKEGPNHLRTLRYVWNGNEFTKEPPNQPVKMDR